jgi:hypothetical protein
LDAGGAETIRMRRRPASKKRRCTKSRDAGQRLGGERYEARYEVLDLGDSKSGGLETRGRIKQCGAIFADRGFDFVGACNFK